MNEVRRPPEPFSRDEIVDTGERAWGSEIEEATTTGRRVESAGQIAARPSTAFVDIVMAAVAREPLPAPARAAGEAVRHGRLARTPRGSRRWLAGDDRERASRSRLERRRWPW